MTRPTLALIGEAGEREYVIPESKMRGGGVSVAVTVNSGTDAREVAQAAAVATYRSVFGAIENSGSTARRVRHALERRL